MNLRLFTIALLAAAIPLAASAGAKEISLDKGDFLTAKRLDKNGEELVSVKLSKSGKAKLKKLNAREALAETRCHWGIENKFHWVLDTAFKEDERKAARQKSIRIAPYWL